MWLLAVMSPGATGPVQEGLLKAPIQGFLARDWRIFVGGGGVVVVGRARVRGRGVVRRERRRGRGRCIVCAWFGVGDGLWGG